MEISILLMEQIAELFLMILMGYIIVKTGLLKGDDSKVISKIVLYLVIPCVIINAFQVDYTSEKVKELLLVFAASVLLQVILLAAVWGVGKVLKLNEVEMTSIYYSNSGNLIVPLVTFILGKEWVLYGCVFMSVQLVFLWTHGKNTISREGKWDWKKIVFNINMIVTGMLIAEMNLKSIFENVKVYFISFLRLVVIPVISLMILKISGLVNVHPDGKKLLLIVFLAVITPSASTITQMCQVYGNDSKYASAINVMTTLLSIVTMPLMVLLYQTVM